MVRVKIPVKISINNLIREVSYSKVLKRIRIVGIY